MSRSESRRYPENRTAAHRTTAAVDETLLARVRQVSGDLGISFGEAVRTILEWGLETA